MEEARPDSKVQILSGKKGIWSEDWETALQAEVEEELSRAIMEEERVSPPAISSIFEGVYAKQPWFSKEQEESEKQLKG